MTTVEKAALELIEEVLGPLDLHDFFKRLLEALRHAVRSEWASLNDLGPGPDDVVVVAIPEVPPRELAAFMRLRDQNPLISRYASTRDGRPYRFSDLISQKQLHGLQIYREVYGPLGVEHQVAFTLPAAEDRILGIALSRARPDYSDREIELIERCRPVLIQLYRNAIEYERLRSRDDEDVPSLRARLRRAGLSHRQAEVVALRLTGLTAAEVADRLRISVRTASKHTQLAYRALGVHGLDEARSAASRLLTP